MCDVFDNDCDFVIDEDFFMIQGDGMLIIGGIG